MNFLIKHSLKYLIFFIFFLINYNIYPLSNYDDLSAEEKIKITYDLIGDKMFMVNENEMVFFGIEMDSKIEKVFDIYGYTIEPKKSDINDYEIYYDFPTISVYVKDSKVKYIITKPYNQKFKTSKGISIGNKMFSLKKIYGVPYEIRKENDYKLYDYYISIYILTFQVNKKNEIYRFTVYFE